MTQDTTNQRLDSRFRMLSIIVAVTILLIAMNTFAHSPRGKAAQSSTQETGSISGKILFQGERPKLEIIKMSNDPICESEQKGQVYAQDGEVNENGTLPNAFVYIKDGFGTRKFTPPVNSVDLTQSGCMYQPHVVGIMAGQPLQVLTLDPTTHNIHVTAKTNRSWNVSQQPGSPSVIRRFTDPEVMIPVHCNVHPWMKAYIGVMENPFFEVTGKDGTFDLKNIPPGEYTLAVWTATFGTQEKRVVVRAALTSTADFTFGQQ
ncbi:MAG TPA: carboxypeptidase regulatory-like domain-containing protein [Candidatus Acidoferrales bacterium]|nr:carboxypeptidase regulatory-like domain-containing protein [Candidatus Acidoferrales bacterium]